MTGIIHYFVTADDGTVIQSGTCQENLLKQNACGGMVHIGEAPRHACRYVDGQFIPIVKSPSYAEMRAGAYPAVTEQLDALWHAMDLGQLSKAEPFYSSIKQVKDKYPKP